MYRCKLPLVSVALAVLSLSGCSDRYSQSEGDADTAATLTQGSTDDENDEHSDSGDECKADADCADHPNGPVCDEAVGLCFPECEPGDTDECYDGPAATEGIGVCAAGSATCSEVGTWGECVGSTLPGAELCGNDIDENCDGSLLAEDKDGDGWTTCDGDCCDDELLGCIDAHLVNPGAFEVEGNEVDDDCDGTIDEVEPSCDAGLASDAGDPLAFAAALDLCQTTVTNAPLAERTWGVISADLTLADGGGAPLPVQHAIRTAFGDQISPSGGDSLVVLSTGHAAAPGQTNPAFAAFESGENLGTSVDAPADWVAANGGEFPATGCAGENPSDNTDANDSVMLSLRVRVPTNARSFTARMFFFSAEYPEWVCSEYNDFFVALIDSDAEDNPATKNIAVFDNDGDLVPVGLNILKTAPALFAVCESGNVGCQGDLPAAPHSCDAGPAQLAGTGFDAIDGSQSCNGNGFPVGGATGWLEMSGNVEPGEIMDIRFAVWDAGGHLFDALVLLDDWQWSLDAAAPGVDIP